MPNAGTLRTLRLSATSGTRDLASMIASANTAGAGSAGRVYKFIVHQKRISPSDYYFDYLGGNRDNTYYFKQLYHRDAKAYV